MRLGILLLPVLVLLFPSLAQARWLEARSPGFIVYSDGGEDDLRRSVMLLEAYDQLLRQLTGTTAAPSPSPLKVYRVASTGKLQQIRKLVQNVRGFYTTRVGGTAAFAVRGDRPGLDGEEVLLHEYAHHFAVRYYPASYPTWYSEGFAEYMMTTRFEADRIEIGRYNPNRAATLLRGTWLPIERVLSDGIGGLSPEEVGQYYAESWLIVHYIFAAADRRDALTRYLADLHRSVAEPDAFQAAFGMDHAAFEADLKRYMQGGIAYGVIARPVAPAVEISLRTLPEAADDLLLPHAALMLGIRDPKDEITLLETVRKVTAAYPDDPYAQRVLARAEINSGDRAGGVAMIDRLLQQASDDAELLYVRGVADFYSGRRDEVRRAALFAAARPWFARAVAADPGYYTARYRLAQCAPAEETAEISDETLAHLITAQALAPLVGDIAIDTATALMARRRYAEAQMVLLPIAANPHGGNVGRARALLAGMPRPGGYRSR